MPTFESARRMRNLMARYYVSAKLARYTFRKVAWITSGGPVEPLIALGFIPIYPENHGAMIGARKMGLELCSVAEELGYSQDLCSYFRVDLGQSVVHRSPVDGIPLLAKPGLPRPDVLVCCNNICGTVLKWYEVQARRFNVPLLFVDTPFNYDGLTPAIEAYALDQMHELVQGLEKVARRKLNPEKLKLTSRLSADAVALWRQVLATCASRPSPMSCFDAFFFLAPIVTLRGTPEVLTFYRGLLRELEAMTAKGEGAVMPERHRLIWDNIPIWHKVGKLSKVLAKSGACLVADTYTNAWADNDFDPSSPMESMARVYSSIFLNRPIEKRIDNLCELIERFKANGFVMHSNRSCKPYSFGQLDIKEAVTARMGVPGLILEADMTDPRAYAEEQTLTRIQAFVETLEAGE